MLSDRRMTGRWTAAGFFEAYGIFRHDRTTPDLQLCLHRPECCLQEQVEHQVVVSRIDLRTSHVLSVRPRITRQKETARRRPQALWFDCSSGPLPLFSIMSTYVCTHPGSSRYRVINRQSRHAIFADDTAPGIVPDIESSADKGDDDRSSGS